MYNIITKLKDKAYIAMKKILYDVIDKGKKKVFETIEHLKLIFKNKF